MVDPQTGRLDLLNSPLIGFFISQHGNVIQVDEPFARLLGYRHASDLIGCALLELVHPRDRSTAEPAAVIPPSLDVYELALRFRKRGGGYLRAIVRAGGVRVDGAPATVGCLLDADDRYHLQDILGKDESVQSIGRLIEALSKMDTAVLITGEQGTGKALLARMIHADGPRALKPFVTVNCSAMEADGWQQDIFGTAGASLPENRGGGQPRFQAIDGGTILLQTIGNLSSTLQLQLLRLLRENAAGRAEKTNRRRGDVRIIACTQADLAARVHAGTFNKELYAYLKTAEIRVPPLRRRWEEIAILADRYRRIFNHRSGGDIKGMSSNALKLLLDFDWPENVRQLAHVMAQACSACREKTIRTAHLPPSLQKPLATTDPDDRSPLADRRSEQSLKLLDALNKTLWNKTKAAQYLGISRQTLYRHLQTYGLDPVDRDTADPDD